jgi:hypothetical protein
MKEQSLTLELEGRFNDIASLSIQKNTKGLRAIAFPSQNQSAEQISLKQNGDRLSFALLYRLFQKLNDRLGLCKRLDLELSFCDRMSWLWRAIGFRGVFFVGGDRWDVCYCDRLSGIA